MKQREPSRNIPPQPAVLLDVEMDPVHLGELREMLGAKSLNTLITRHCGEIEAVIKTLQAPDALPPLPEIAARAHKIAGSAAALGAVSLRKGGLLAVEQAAKAENAEDLAAAIKALPTIWEATQPALTAAV